ncbi:MAG TPA: hypothetical protein VKQ11_22600 [Candidatus Sulfotelmatobacter sp.]|nr:hypothetical protein [Candidatus Sulfotelmatobacter sp.]
MISLHLKTKRDGMNFPYTGSVKRFRETIYCQTRREFVPQMAGENLNAQSFNGLFD